MVGDQLPSAAPSTEAFAGNSPFTIRTVVAAGMPRVGKGAGSPFCQPPAKASERRMQAAVGWAFFWLLFFAQTKKSNSPVGAITDIQNGFAKRIIVYRQLKTVLNADSVA
jgi:hypothetical protein